MRLCECGCGQPTELAKQSRAARGFLKGQPQRFIRGHVAKKQIVKKYRYATLDGKSLVEHRAIAIKALGKPLPAGVEVHHVNGIKADNRNQNLVICPDAGYHKLLHRRQRVKNAGGNPNTQWICSTCQQLLPLELFHVRKVGVQRECKPCVYARAKAHLERNRPALRARERELRLIRKLKKQTGAWLGCEEARRRNGL